MADQPVRDAESVAPLMGTCDVCAEGPRLIVEVDPDTEAYMCDRCWSFEEKAIRAAAEVLRIELPRSNAPYQVHLARKVIDAYHAAYNDGDACSACDQPSAEEMLRIDGVDDAN